MRFENFDPHRFDEEIKKEMMSRAIMAGEIVAERTRQNLKAQIGLGITTGINRPVYKKGKYKGERWTARHFGNLMKSVRVVQRYEKYGKLLYQKGNVRVYIGNYLAYYASIFEFYRPFLRPAFYSSQADIKDILGAK